LQTGNPRPLVLLAYHLGVAESAMHKRLWRWHLNGEWFHPSDAVLSEISCWHWLDVRQLVRIRQTL
jgi:hypothetical protein